MLSLDFDDFGVLGDFQSGETLCQILVNDQMFKLLLNVVKFGFNRM